jgi:outer membrane protein assembly factor BamB
MRLKAISGIALTAFLLGMLTLTFNVQPVAASASVDWWPMRGHDLSHTGYSTSTAPNTNNTIWTYTTSGNVVSSPAVADGKVYVGSSYAKVYCLDALTGAHIWNYTTGNWVESSPAVADGKVYVGSYDFRVYCLDASNGAHVWNYTTDGAVHSSPAVADGKVYVGSNDFRVYCLNALTGAHIWNYTTGSYVGSSPAIADGKVYVGSYDLRVYAFADLVWSTDSAGNSKATFNLTDNVYVRGQGFPADTSVTIYLIPDGADALPSNKVANAFATTNGIGDLPVTLVWSQPLTLGEYDIWVDVNQNGVFDEGDVWNSQSIGIYRFDVIPEFPTLISVLLILIIPTVAIALYKRRLLKTPIH